ncbi:hypothetical protein GCM10018952_58910 [Streptosporangium vulgare]
MDDGSCSHRSAWSHSYLLRVGESRAGHDRIPERVVGATPWRHIRSAAPVRASLAVPGCPLRPVPEPSLRIRGTEVREGSRTIDGHGPWPDRGTTEGAVGVTGNGPRPPPPTRRGKPFAISV